MRSLWELGLGDVLPTAVLHCSSQQHVLPSGRDDILLEAPQIPRAGKAVAESLLAGLG